jgi:hypothetical protein
VSELKVTVDNRVRLVAAALSASDWVEKEQELAGRHAVHPHAKQTRHYLADFADHPLITHLNQIIAEDGDLSHLFSVAARCSWPMFDVLEPLPEPHADGLLAGELADFYVDTAIAAFFWSEHAAAWQEAERDLRAIFHNNLLAEFIGQLRGHPLEQSLVVTPNLLYPVRRSLVATTQSAYYLILSLPPAWGESAPWPFRDGVDWTLSEACRTVCEVVLAETLTYLDENQRALLLHAAATLFLERAIGEPAALSYLVQTKKAQKLPQLPVIVENLREQLRLRRTDVLALFTT